MISASSIIFTDCKFKASLRVYTGNSEECERKLQSSPERQQEMKIIKKKIGTIIKKLHSFPSRLSQFPPLPYTSQEEVMRLISSASKLIVAATCEISSEEIKKPDCASPQKRKEDKNIQRLDHYCKQRTPPLVISPDPHEYDAKSIDIFCFKSTRETNKLEESNADFIQEDSGNDYGKRDKKVQDAISNVHTRDIILTDPCDWQMAHIPQKAQCCCTCAEQQRNFISETSDEEQDSFSDSSVTVTSILGASENEQSEEFIVSSVSDSLSLRSLSDVHEQMEKNNCVDQKEEENSDSSIGHLDQRVLEEMQKISTSDRLAQTNSFHFRY
ncbi:unnamed protein product [Natator depressus]